jgi:hypothetical protein
MPDAAVSAGMQDTVTPVTPTETSTGNKLLDALIGLGALALLLPLAPFIVALWLWDRFRSGNDATTAEN